jgi:hypothetical protein
MIIHPFFQNKLMIGLDFWLRIHYAQRMAATNTMIVGIVGCVTDAETGRFI